MWLSSLKQSPMDENSLPILQHQPRSPLTAGEMYFDLVLALPGQVSSPHTHRAYFRWVERADGAAGAWGSESTPLERASKAADGASPCASNPWMSVPSDAIRVSESCRFSICSTVLMAALAVAMPAFSADTNAQKRPSPPPLPPMPPQRNLTRTSVTPPPNSAVVVPTVPPGQFRAGQACGRGTGELGQGVPLARAEWPSDDG